MTTVDARLARLEERWNQIHESVDALTEEQARSRTRLHNLEGIAQTLVDQEKTRAAATKRQQDSIRLWLQILSLVVAAFAVVTPFIYHALTGG